MMLRKLFINETSSAHILNRYLNPQIVRQGIRGDLIGNDLSLCHSILDRLRRFPRLMHSVPSSELRAVKAAVLSRSFLGHR